MAFGVTIDRCRASAGRVQGRCRTVLHVACGMHVVTWSSTASSGTATRLSLQNRRRKSGGACKVTRMSNRATCRFMVGLFPEIASHSNRLCPSLRAAFCPTQPATRDYLSKAMAIVNLESAVVAVNVTFFAYLPNFLDLTEM